MIDHVPTTPPPPPDGLYWVTFHFHIKKKLDE